MKIGKITSTNSKGQIVIPQEYRELLGITEEVNLNIVPKATGIFIQPVGKVAPDIPTDDLYEKVLKNTVGGWREGSFDKTKEERRKIELEASKRRRTEW